MLKQEKREPREGQYIVIITVGIRNVCFCERSQPMPARPSGKGRQKERHIFEKRRGNVFESVQQERVRLSGLRFVSEGCCHYTANRSL